MVAALTGEWLSHRRIPFVFKSIVFAADGKGFHSGIDCLKCGVNTIGGFIKISDELHRSMATGIKAAFTVAACRIIPEQTVESGKDQLILFAGKFGEKVPGEVHFGNQQIFVEILYFKTLFQTAAGKGVI